jgi:anti-sigma B factor antagonist
MPQISVVTSSTETRHADSTRFLCTLRRGTSGAAWVLVEGELSQTSSPQLEQTLADARLCARLVVLDLRELTCIGRSGVRVILEAARRTRRAGGRLMLVRGPAEVDRELTLTGASDHVLIFDLDPSEPGRTLLDVA